MNLKAKGTNAERELIHLFWAAGWASLRCAGSGSMRYPSPDILAGNSLRKLAIECKTSKNNNIYIPIKELNELKEFSNKFGAEAWVGVKVQKEWYFLNLEDTNQTVKNHSISLVLAKQKGLLFDELIGNI